MAKKLLVLKIFTSRNYIYIKKENIIVLFKKQFKGNMGKKFRVIFLFLLSLVLISSFFFVVYEGAQYPVYYKAEIIKNSHNFEVDPEIVASLIRVESSYRKDVVSSKGAVGLMQLLPSTAGWVASKIGMENFSQEMLYDANTNIMLGTYYIKYLLNKFGSLSEAICAYNAGEGVVLNWLGNKDISQDGKTLSNVPYSETQSHLEKFKKALRVYKKKYKDFRLEKINVAESK